MPTISGMYESNFQNHFLIAQDTQASHPFHRTVIYVCEHNSKGAMGLVINRNSGLQLADVFSSMEIVLHNKTCAAKPVMVGGPVQENVGFVLHHSHEQNAWLSSMQVSQDIAITTSKDILEAIADNLGPSEAVMVLGYSGWGPGQLEQEIKDNFWLVCPAQQKIIFDTPIEQRWVAAIRLLGIEPTQLVSDAGHA